MASGQERNDPPVARIEPDERPTVLIVGGTERSAAMAGWAARAGLRCVGTIALDAVADRMASTVALDLVLVDLRGMPEPALNRATAQSLAARFGLPRTRLAVITDLAGLDGALAMLDAPESEFLCEPPDSEIVSLLVMAGLRPAKPGVVVLHDNARESESARLEKLSEEVRRLAETIERISQSSAGDGVLRDSRNGYRAGAYPLAAGPGADGARLFQPRERSRDAQMADGDPSPADYRAIIRARRLREQYLPAELFADPAWDMILDLMAARLAGQRVSVSSLCIAAAVPPTTALRWIRQLTDRAVFARIDDPVDGRRVFIELTDAGAQAVIAWTQAVRRSGGLLTGARN